MGSEQREASDPKKPNPSNTYLKYSSLAIQLVVVIGLFGWIGYLLDQYLNLTFPVFLLTMVLVAFTGMVYQLYREINKS